MIWVQYFKGQHDFKVAGWITDLWRRPGRRGRRSLRSEDSPDRLGPEWRRQKTLNGHFWKNKNIAFWNILKWKNKFVEWFWKREKTTLFEFFSERGWNDKKPIYYFSRKEKVIYFEYFWNRNDATNRCNNFIVNLN